MKNKYSKLAFLFSTFFGIGKIPFAPGTIGSFFAFPSYILIIAITVLIRGPKIPLSLLETNSIVALVAVLGFFIGCYVTGLYSKQIKKEDPKEIIIDELVAQLLLISGLMMTLPYLQESQIIITKFFFFPENFYYLVWLGSFILFRFFDIYKPWPINEVDARIKGGIGIMLDDIIAAIFSYFIVIAVIMVIGSYII